MSDSTSSVAPSSASTPPSSSAPESSSTAPSSASQIPSSTSSSAPSASNSASASASATASSASQTSASATSNASSASATTSSPSSTTQHTITSTVYYTSVDGNGSTVIGSSISVGAEQTGSSGGGTNTGAIVGGVVGGVAGLVILAALAWFLLRKRRKSHRAEFDDMMFDPSRAQNHGAIDLADNSVSPYVAPGVASTQSPEMTQYARSATSDGNYGYEQDLSRGPSTATSSAGFAGRGAGGYPQGMPSSPPPMPTIHAGAEAGAMGMAGAAGAAGGAMSAKQREAMNEQQRFRVANHGQPGPSGHGAPSSSGAIEGEPGSPGSGGPVTVAEDGGAANENEIPPTYDSIRR